MKGIRTSDETKQVFLFEDGINIYLEYSKVEGHINCKLHFYIPATIIKI